MSRWISLLMMMMMMMMMMFLTGCGLLSNSVEKEHKPVTEVVSDKKLAELQEAFKEDINEKELIRELGLEDIFTIDFSNGRSETVDIDLKQNLSRDKEYLTERKENHQDTESTNEKPPIEEEQVEMEDLDISDLEELEKQVSETLEKFLLIEQHLNELEVLIDELDEHDRLDDDIAKLEALLNRK
jgi:hypothetical protein